MFGRPMHMGIDVQWYSTVPSLNSCDIHTTIVLLGRLAYTLLLALALTLYISRLAASTFYDTPVHYGAHGAISIRTSESCRPKKEP